MENMENQNTTEKVYKTRECVRKCVSKYERNLKEKNPEQYRKRLELHRQSYARYKERLNEKLKKLSMYENSLVVDEVH